MPENPDQPRPNRRNFNPFANLLPSLIPKTQDMMRAMVNAIHSPAENLLQIQRSNILRRRSYRVHHSRKLRSVPNLSLAEKRTRKNHRRASAGMGKRHARQVHNAKVRARL